MSLKYKTWLHIVGNINKNIITHTNHSTLYIRLAQAITLFAPKHKIQQLWDS